MRDGDDEEVVAIVYIVHSYSCVIVRWNMLKPWNENFFRLINFKSFVECCSKVILGSRFVQFEYGGIHCFIEEII